MNSHYPIDTQYNYTLVPLEQIYVYEFIADYLDEKRIIVESEANMGRIRPFYNDNMIEGDPRDLVRKIIDDEKIASLERVFCGIDESLLPPVVLRRISPERYMVINGMHRFTLSLLYRLKVIPAIL
jgi:hypothetical protein